MALCRDCFNNCGDGPITDQCVKYTGPDITFLGIEQGDQLSLLEAAIIAKLEDVLDGSGITLTGLTSCTAIDAALGTSDKTLYNVIQALYTVFCALRVDVNAIQTAISLPTSFDTECLEDLPVSPTRDDILQAALIKLCAVATDVTTIKADYVTTANICTLVTACLSGGSTQENTKMPKYCPIPYYGPLSVFDGSGNGLSVFGYDKVYLCVGQTIRGFVLPDMRGRVPVGVNSGVPGGALDSAVDPSFIQNAEYTLVKGTKVGELAHTLANTEVPAHTHGITDPGHTHTIGFGSDNTSGNNHNNFAKLDSTSVSRTTNSRQTGITINSSGGGQPHNNVQPSIGTYYIIYIP